LGSTRRHLCPQVYRQGQHACAHASYWAPTTLFHTWAYMTASNLPPWAPVTRRCPVRGQTRVTNIANLRCTQRRAASVVYISVPL
ncbi:hypothetical protein PSTT_10237, partial [Puccinia striiformis]